VILPQQETLVTYLGKVSLALMLSCCSQSQRMRSLQSPSIQETSHDEHCPGLEANALADESRHDGSM
jgi:hypothetical protein